MYSSIEISSRSEVIAKCFWPLIKLAKSGFKIGIEAPAQTLEIAYDLDKRWVESLNECLEKNEIEFVGSGYSQMIGTLAPYSDNIQNIEEGKRSYQRILNRVPEIWMSNEQTYSRGVAEFLLDCNINKVIVDWNSTYGVNPDWSQSLKFQTQTAFDSKGRPIKILWSQSIAFQLFQKHIHQENDDEEYFEFLTQLKKDFHSNVSNSHFCIYGNDAEIFNFRPGRFKTEPSLSPVDEWKKIQTTMTQISEMGFDFILPSECFGSAVNLAPLNLTNLIEPNTTKKQPKYNVTRWCLTGRNSPKLNQFCFDLKYHIIDPKKKCYYWSSDFRTHITSKRWEELDSEIHRIPPIALDSHREHLDNSGDAFLKVESSKPEVKTKNLAFKLNSNRGMTIESVGFKNESPILGRHSIGTFSEMAYSADWYTGNTVLQIPGKSQVTDLKKCELYNHSTSSENVYKTKIPFLDGFLNKTLTLATNEDSWTYEYNFENMHVPIGSLRFCFLNFLNIESKNDVITVKTHLGGNTLEEFIVPNRDFDHGSPPTSAVSSNQALGLTEGVLFIETASCILDIKLEQSSIRPVAMIENKMLKNGRFFRVYFSISEYDETRKAPFEFANETVRINFKLRKK